MRLADEADDTTSFAGHLHLISQAERIIRRWLFIFSHWNVEHLFKCFNAIAVKTDTAT